MKTCNNDCNDLNLQPYGIDTIYSFLELILWSLGGQDWRIIDKISIYKSCCALTPYLQGNTEKNVVKSGSPEQYWIKSGSPEQYWIKSGSPENFPKVRIPAGLWGQVRKSGKNRESSPEVRKKNRPSPEVRQPLPPPHILVVQYTMLKQSQSIPIPHWPWVPKTLWLVQ